MKLKFKLTSRHLAYLGLATAIFFTLYPIYGGYPRWYEAISQVMWDITLFIIGLLVGNSMRKDK